MKSSILIMSLVAVGCAVPPQQRQSVTAIASEPTLPIVAPVTWRPAIEQVPTSPPAVVREPKQPDFRNVITKSAATFAFDPDHEYVFSCPMWELLTIRLIPGETYQDYGSANLVEWMIQPLQSSVDGEPVPILIVKRGPQAPTATLVIITDKNTYRMRLTPTGKGENRAVRFVRFRDPYAEVRKEEQQIAAEERRRKKAQELPYPTLNQATVRAYSVQGTLPWTPIKVEGDDRHTFIYLPANTGAEVPTLTEIRDGEAVRINTRTIPGNGVYGTVIIADGAFSEANLTGQNGQVVITGGNEHGRY